jgi:hypothetical protein
MEDNVDGTETSTNTLVSSNNDVAAALEKQSAKVDDNGKSNNDLFTGAQAVFH